MKPPPGSGEAIIEFEGNLLHTHWVTKETHAGYRFITLVDGRDVLDMCTAVEAAHSQSVFLVDGVEYSYSYGHLDPTWGKDAVKIMVKTLGKVVPKRGPWLMKGE